MERTGALFGALVGAFAMAATAFGTVRTISGVEGALKPGDDTNRGFWDVSARPVTTVDDGTATIAFAVDASGGSTRARETTALDLRAFSYDYSDLTAIRTDPKGGHLIIIR